MWFNKFCSIYTSKYYKAAPQLFAYVYRIMGLHRRNPKAGLWHNYDEEFHRIKACCPGLPWHLLQSQILAEVQDFISDDLDTSNLCGNQQNKEKNGGNKKLKFPPNGTCHPWNRGNCKKTSCKYTHTCAYCKGDHRAISCTSKSK